MTNDAHNQGSETWIASQLAKQQIFEIPSIFAVEVGGALRRRSGNAEGAKRAVSRIHKDPYFQITDLDRRFAVIAADTSVRFGLKGADAIYVALAQNCALPLVTWDNEQREHAGQIIDVMTPAQALEHMA
ncbi:hypothetical protein BH23CHL4_BH23CHL4_03350 [soil metagenome]